MRDTILTNANDYIKNAWLNIGDTSKIDLSGPLSKGLFADENDSAPAFLLQTMLNPQYFSMVCKEILGVELLPFQAVILEELWYRPFPMLIATRGAGKSFILALYAVLRAFLNQGSKVVLVGAAFRQSKIIFEYMADIWRKAPILRDICGNGREQGPKFDIDRCTMTIGESRIIAIPLGDGQKIRGLRANYIICDEFASINKEIFENVVRGFAAVSSNPVESVKKQARKDARSFLNIGEAPTEDEFYTGNQTIISGTAYFGFNHFHDYWERNKKIINSRGEKHKLELLFPDGIDPNFDYRDYSIMRLPYHLLPRGFMDSKQIAHAKANIHKSYFWMEYGACFAKDSDGFFKRSMIEKCVAKPENELNLPSCGNVRYAAATRGNPRRKYVIAIDPASENDNFSIVVLELHPDHTRIVYIWTSTRKRHAEIVKAGLTPETDFYAFCARKIRSLIALFPSDNVGLDGQGGGIAIEEALHDKGKLDPQLNEVQIWPIIDPEEEKPTDDFAGLHILHIFQFADAEWVGNANHWLRKDLEDKVLLFPEFDTIQLGLSIEEDKVSNRKFDTLEDCVMEIEQLKDELASIVLTQTPNGRDKWSTPEEKLPGGKKGRQRKDRYSALLMANYIAHTINRKAPVHEYKAVGGFVGGPSIQKDQSKGGTAFSNAPEWFKNGANNLYR